MTERVNEISLREAPAKRRGGAGFVHDDRGLAAIEMAMIAAPFFLLIAAILEYSFGNYAQSHLDAVVQQAAREIMTGAVQNQTVNGKPLDATQFRTKVMCPKLPAIMNCEDLYVDVQAFEPPAGGGAPATTPYENYLTATKDGVKPPALDNAQNAYCVGGARKFVVLRVAYPAPILTTSAVFPNAATYKGRKARILTTTATFKNEPFPTSRVGC